MKKALLVAALISLLSACSNTNENVERVPEKSPAALFEDAQELLEVGNFSGATRTLEALSSRYPFGPHANQVQLDLIYAYYKLGQTAQALATSDRFIRLNPTHPDNDYVLYMRGLTNLDADQEVLQNLLGIDRSDRDPNLARQAFEDFSKVLGRYPNSKYAPDARQRMIYIKERLAKHELSVARYYIKRQAYIAAANRGRYIIETFSDSSSTEGALEVMVQAYDKLGLQDLKADAQATLRLNFPENPLAQKS
ncbi:outer membrane protein assembly factor BamD [Corallincola luteus]|uniref:Outer membrane protein assembly factor BamD n=1 Tax=Corallincola luteus TaxID=1775177 RepID=A0ABY2AHM7_9GAMM|nr:outer membrane protein assembly factor BamD [Corallincola luteus]TCI02128.1 outer membrane protein assembly factor BamD [Corallincola luteus]